MIIIEGGGRERKGGNVGEEVIRTLCLTFGTRTDAWHLHRKEPFRKGTRGNAHTHAYLD